MPKSCAGHNSHTAWDNLILFGWDIYQVKKVCSMQEGQLLLCWVFTPVNTQQVPLPLQGIYFCYFFFSVYVHLSLKITYQFKVFANIVYSVQIIISEVIIRLFDKNKTKTNKRTRKNKIIHITPIFVFNYYYLCMFLLCSRSIYPWYRLKYTKLRDGGLVGRFAISSDGYF